MPRIKRWFHVSHDINSDGEVWELTDKFGVAGLRLWLELLSIADRNEGHLPPLSEATMRQLSIKCNTSQTRVRLVCDWAVTRAWVVCDPSPRIRNWLIYNPPRDTKKSQTASPPNPPNPPSLPKEDKKAASPNGFAEFWSLYPKKKSKGQAEKTWLKIHVTPELLATILAGVRRAKHSRDWLKNSGEFIPHPSTWLNAKGWEDQEVSYSAPRTVSQLKAADKPLTEEEKERNKELLRETINSLSKKMASE